MSTVTKVGPEGLGSSDLGSLRGAWLCMLCMGIFLIVLGAVTISSSFFIEEVVTVAAMVLFGVLLLLGGISEIVTAFWGRPWRGFFLHLLIGILYLIAGVFMLERPVTAALALTLLIAANLLIDGILRIVVSVADRFDGRGWTLLGGIVSVLLGIAIWRQWPLSGFWVIGLFVGIEMLFLGMSWVTLGLAARAVAKTATPA
jgi:uncharacterized membrane protein HdeD (DUF308 family)